MLREPQLVEAQVPQAITITITIGPAAGNTQPGRLLYLLFLFFWFLLSQFPVKH